MNKESPLWRRIHGSGIGTLAVVGMSKNTGKTVVLNYLLQHAAAASVTVGVTSIGRDGEERDQVFFIAKPPVMVWPGNLVATARHTLRRSKVRCTMIAATGIDSPMGEIVIVKALEHGEMEIAGASRSSDQRKVIARLKACACGLVILDGALGRSQHASPAIADGVILATGAALGGGILDVIRKTRDRLAILGIAQADPATAERCADVIANGGVGLWDRHGAPLFRANIATLNAGPVLLDYAAREVAMVAMVALSGAVGRSLWSVIGMLAERHPGLTVVVADGSKLFIDNSDLASFARAGGRLVGQRGIRIAGLTLNPCSPLGGNFCAEEFLSAARLAFRDYAVSDVMQEEKIQERGALR